MSEFTFFYSHARGRYKKFSQWFRCDIYENGKRFTCAEQYMMYKKAKLFGDKNAKHRIYAEVNPATIKRLGRKIKNFDPEVWDAHKYEIVLRGNLLKFREHGMKQLLLKTRNSCIVEASPYDRIWGIGFSEKNALANIEDWGENLLGKVLQDVRDIVRAEA